MSGGGPEAPRELPSEAQLLDGIREVVRRELGRDATLRPEMRLVEDLALDSLRLLTLAVALEDHYRVCIDDEEAGIETVGDLVAVVRGKLAQRD